MSRHMILAIAAVCAVAPLYAFDIEKAQYTLVCRDRPKWSIDPVLKVDGLSFAIEFEKPADTAECMVAVYPQVRLRDQWVYLVCKGDKNASLYSSSKRSNPGPFYKGPAATDFLPGVTGKETTANFFIPHSVVNFDGSGLAPGQQHQVDFRIEVAMYSTGGGQMTELAPSLFSQSVAAKVTPPARPPTSAVWERFRQDEGPFRRIRFDKK